MKTISKMVLVVFATIFLNSCLNGEYQSTPRMIASNLYRHSITGVHDTLYYGDTIQVGDTMFAPIALDGVYNSLVSFQVTGDKTAFEYKLLCDSASLPLLASDSKPEEGSLHFANDCYLFFTTLYYIPIQAGKYQFSFVLASSAGEKFSPVSGYFTQVVVNP